MSEKQLTDAELVFILGLEKLTRETGVAIAGCGCCDSPSLCDVTPDQLAPESGYGCDRDGGNVNWYSFDPKMPHRWEDDRKLIVKGASDER